MGPNVLYSTGYKWKELLFAKQGSLLSYPEILVAENLSHPDGLAEGGGEDNGGREIGLDKPTQGTTIS